MTRQGFTALLLAASAAVPASLSAQENAPPEAQNSVQDSVQDSVIVAAGQAENASGRVAINLAAGNGNQQAGAAAIAIGDTALAGISLDQMSVAGGAGDRATRIAIGPRAFAGIQGLASVNITAGQNNQSANLAGLAIGTGGALTDIALSQSSAPTGPKGAPDADLQAGNDSIDISSDAFLGGSGLLQVNLVGGERNSSANTFVLSVSGNGN